MSHWPCSRGSEAMRPPVEPPRLVPLVRLADALLRRSARFVVEDPERLLERAGPAVYVCRHGQLWPVLWSVRGTDTSVLVSHSPDGELLGRVLAGWGFGVIRGSTSSAGFSGARGALRTLRDGRCVGLAVDGPRGPRGAVQEGAIRLARQAGVPLVPLSAEGRGTWVLRQSWDHFEIPRPGARIRVRVGPAVHVDPGPQGILEARAAIQQLLGEPAGSVEAGVAGSRVERHA